MTTYNGQRYISETMRSLLAQTYKDFEFIIVDDGSSDATAEIVNSFKDSRIKLIVNKRNLGISGAANAGLGFCNGKYIVRHDQDDISLPQRIEREVAFMEANPKIGVCGTWYKEFGERKKTKRNVANPESLAVKLLRGCYIQQPTAIIRKSVLDKFSIRYRENLAVANDYCMWLDMLGRCKFANIPEVLFKYRIHKTQTGKRYKSVVRKEYAFSRKQFFGRYENSLTDAEIEMFSYNLIDGDLPAPEQARAEYDKLGEIAVKIIGFNRLNKIWDETELVKFLRKMWRKLCIKNAFGSIGYFRLKKILETKLKEL